jgi:hypothetical protein
LTKTTLLDGDDAALLPFEARFLCGGEGVAEAGFKANWVFWVR